MRFAFSSAISSSMVISPARSFGRNRDPAAVADLLAAIPSGLAAVFGDGGSRFTTRGLRFAAVFCGMTAVAVFCRERRGNGDPGTNGQQEYG